MRAAFFLSDPRNFTSQRDGSAVRGGLHDAHHDPDSATDDEDDDMEVCLSWSTRAFVLLHVT